MGATDHPPPTGPTDDDLATLSRVANELAAGIERALPAWVVRSVVQVHLAQGGGRPAPEVQAEAEAAGQAAAEQLGPEVRHLLAADIDEQRTNPLSIVRRATPFPTEVLRRAGVAPVDRDAEAVRQFPDDLYDLTPTAFADLDPDLREVGIVWGAAKAHVHLARRRAEGRR